MQAECMKFWRLKPFGTKDTYYVFYDPPRLMDNFSKLYSLEIEQKSLQKKRLDIIIETICLIKKAKEI